MGKHENVILGTILVFLVVADVSNASNFRKLVDSPLKQINDNSSDSLISSPKLPVKQTSPVGKEKQIEPHPASKNGEDSSSKGNEVTKDTNVTPLVDVKEHSDNSSSKEVVKEKGKVTDGKKGEKESVKADGKEGQEEEQKEKEKEKEKVEEKEKEKVEEKEKQKEVQKDKEKEDHKTNVPVKSGESCEAMETKCQDSKSMTACIKSIDQDSKALVLLIQNKGYSSLTVNIPALSSRNKQQVVNIPKLQSKLVKMPLADARFEISLTAGNGYCVLNLGAPISQGNFFRWMPSYSKFVTPVYGAYLILAVTLIAGGVWACCWFAKRKGRREIPYQELEMSQPESAVAVETAEGWDEVWDDDWDEENAVKSPGSRSISANGLTSRNPRKDDWEDWDD